MGTALGFLVAILFLSSLTGCTTYLHGWKQQKESLAQMPRGFVISWSNESKFWEAFGHQTTSDFDNWELRSFIDGLKNDIDGLHR